MGWLTFAEYRADHLFAALKRALALFKNRTVWQELVKKVEEAVKL